MKNISIKLKLLVIVIGTIITISTIIALQSIYNITDLSENTIEKYKKEAYTTKELELKNYVSLAMKSIESYHERTSKEKIKYEVQGYIKEQSNFMFTVINNLYKEFKGKVSDKELKNIIKRAISTTRYGKSGYFWVNDFNYKMVMHPIKKELTGKYFKNTPKVAFVQLGTDALKNSSKDTEYIEYSFFNPSSQKTVYKSSIVRVFKPFNWIIGTGAYIDDVTSAMKKEALIAVSKMRYGKSGYFWINDEDSIMTMHPIKPQLAGTDFKKIKDKKGYVWIPDGTNKAIKEGSGFVTYYWPKPGFDAAQPKLSNMQYFKEWGWIIGTGAYIDDIEAKINTMRNDAQNKINSIILQVIIIAIILSIIVIILVSFISNKYIVKPIEEFQKGLLSFFKYLNKESNEVLHLNNDSNDEIGIMSKVVNENINKTKLLIDQDTKLILEVEDVIEKVNNGFYMYQVKGTTSNEGVESLKNTLNNMILKTNEKINAVVEVLGEYGESRFDSEMATRDDMNGSFGSLVASTKLIGNNVSEILAMIMNSGDKLDKDTTVLSNASTDLASSSNQQAASLEETAAALEEITATIQNNTVNIAQMSKITDDVTLSARTGLDLASKTTDSMEEINSQVTAINDAISVIDQIAFQTNILSLNAAVEAATAGEAGKGFAVVAQEVRNLASRSAEAAKEIKNLVDAATIQANHGKEIAQEMINGYNNLNEKISATSTIVTEVQAASKEQEHGIVQINDAITELDQATQQNANTASRISDLSNEVSNLSQNLVTASSRATYNQSARKQVCDVDFVYNTAKLKNAHIIFKTNNFNKLGENKQWTVVNHHECDLGKWMDKQEKNNMAFTKTQNWNDLKRIHEGVHIGVQDYINEDVQNALNSTLVKISSDIEVATVGVFDHLNQLKVEHCQSLS